MSDIVTSKCNQCGKEVKDFKEEPDWIHIEGKIWIATGINPYTRGATTFDFCDEDCFGKWLPPRLSKHRLFKVEAVKGTVIDEPVLIDAPMVYDPSESSDDSSNSPPEVKCPYARMYVEDDPVCIDCVQTQRWNCKK